MNTSKLTPGIVLLAISFLTPLIASSQLPPPPPKPPKPAAGTLISVSTTSEGDQPEGVERMRSLLEQNQNPMAVTFKGGGGKGGGQFQFFNAKPGGMSDRPLIVASSTLEPAALAELGEDLKIMGKLVGDAVADDDASEQRAMGIALKSLPGRDARPQYIEGYGAIFQIAARFPLTPTEKNEAKSPAPATNSPWESARRELSGQPDDGDDSVAPGKGNAYDADKVAALKKSLLKALANANHIRQLKANEKVTVIVHESRTFQSRVQIETGSVDAFTRGIALAQAGAPHVSDQARQVIRVGPGGPGRLGGFPGTAEKILSMSVKKSDADALAAGKISEEEFNKRAAVVIY